MDLGLKGKVAMVAGASRGLGYAVAEALAREGALVSIASRDEQAIAARRAASIGGRRAGRWRSTSGRPRRSSGGPRRPAQRFGGVDLLFTNSGGPPAGAAVSFDDRAWQDAADLLLFSTLRMVRARRAVDEGARRRRHPGVDLVVGEGADSEPRAVDGAARVGVGAGEDAGARARGVEDPRQPDHPRPHRHRPRAAARRDQRQEAGHLAGGGEAEVDRARFRWAATARPTNSAASAAFLLSRGRRYMTGATVQVDGGLIKSVL